MRRAGRIIGEATAELVSILNPHAIILSGRLSDCGDVLLSGLRERVYQRTHPGVTGQLQIARSELGEYAGVIGLALSVADHVFSPAGLEHSAALSFPTPERVEQAS
ncbi:MAG: hypothetical protein ABS64_00350 [Microbacterium sp. SCN 69-37]|nr:MAG: hypothetical protein ABS64_00350 [Microbacterium sp. SCN 69-37]